MVDQAVKKMEGIITYLTFTGATILVTKIVFQIRGGIGIGVEKSVEAPAEYIEPEQGFWDYLLVTGVGVLVLLVIFLTSI